MTMHSITKGLALVASRLVALIAGLICVAGSGAILFEDVLLHGSPIELKHLIIAGILSIALLTGHLRSEAWREGRRTAAVGFFVLFVAATALVVYKSTGKQAEHTFQSQAEADLAADERARVRPLLEAAEAMLSTTMKKIDDDCVNGRKSKGHCDGLRATLGVYQGAVAGHKVTLEKLGAPKPVAPEAESFANLVAVFGPDHAKVKAASVLVVPFIQTILFELGGIWCLGFAFRPLPRSTSKPATQETETKAEAPRQPLSPVEQSDFGGFDVDEARQLGIGGEPGAGNWGNSGNGGGSKPPKGGNGGGKRIYSRGEALLDITRRMASGETVDAQNDLADAWGVDKSTVSKWVKRWREDGLVPSAQRVGRCHRLVAAE